MRSEIRNLSACDIPTLANIFARVYSGDNWNETWSVENASIRLNELVNSPLSIGFVYLLNNAVIGCAICETLSWYDGKHLEIKELFVEPEHQGMGVGTALLREIEKCRHNLNISKLFLWTSNTHTLITFYQKMGFILDVSEVRLTKT